MSRRIVPLAAATLALALTALALDPARAAVPEPADSAKADPAKVAATPDSSRFLPTWLHLHGAAGLGWLASPVSLRKFYQAGQSYEAGLEVQPRYALRMRLNAEYLGLPIVTTSTYTFITMSPGLVPIRDTLHLQTTGQGWLGSGRLEAQLRLTPHVWAVGGIGRGYLDSGLEPIHESNGTETLDLDFPGASSWVWLTTLGGTYEFDFLGPLLSADVRWTGMHHGEVRPQDRMNSWSIRIGWSGF